MMKRLLIVTMMAGYCFLPGSAGAEDEGGWRNWGAGWYVCAYLGQLTASDFSEVSSFQADLVPSYMLALAVGKEVWRYKDLLGVELEAQVANYFNDYVFDSDSPDESSDLTQDHTEFNALFTVRWLKFPWDRHVDTSVAVGEGVSYATSVPAVETYRHGEETSKFLNYLMIESTFGLPALPKWQLVFRLHHRSGAWGLYNGVHGGSNTIGMGLRYQL